MKSRLRYFLYRLATKEIVTFCDKKLAREMLTMPTLAATLALGYRQQVVVPRTTFFLGGRELFDVFPHDGSQQQVLSLKNQ